jgi:P2-related tail formation protein
MSVPIRESRLIDACPPSIADDVNVQAICEALDRQFRELIDDISQTIILPAIDQITDHKLLDLLAWQFHVDFYDAAAPVALKQLVIKASLDWHTRKGTVQLIQDVCDQFFPPGAAVVQEWFEYKTNPVPPNYPIDDPGGAGTWHDRYRFRIIIDQDVVNPEAEQRVAQIVQAYKPLTRWSEGIIRARRSDLEIWWGAASLTWKYVTSEAPAPPWVL